MRRSLAILFVFLLLATSFVVIVPSISHAASPTSFVPITLTNSQTTATAKNFSQLIKVDWSTYATDLNANVSNVRFYSSTTFSSASELSGWIENNNTTTATSSNVWVNLSGTIVPASGSVVVYMAFLSKTASWSSHWGLAPTLSTTYGAFDNGKNVFSYYQRFGGLSALPSPWELAYGSASGTFDATYYVPGASFSDGGITTSSDYNLANMTYDVNASFPLSTTTSASGEGGGPGAANAERTYFIGGGGGIIFAGTTAGASEEYGNYGVSGKWTYSSSNHNAIDQVTYTAKDSVYSVGFNTTTSFFHVNYGESYSNTTDFPSTTTLPLSALSSISGAELYWVRLRVTPPNDVMPSASFGSVTAVSSALKYQISFSQTSLPSGTKWGIRLNNTTTTIWQNSTSEYNNITSLANGAYTYQVINATGYQTSPSTSYTGTLTINGANLTQSITFIGYKFTITESGLPSGDTWFLNLSNQPGLSESTAGQHLSGTSTSLSTYLPNDSYSYTFQTSDHRYSGGSGSFSISGASYSASVTFSAVLYYVNFTQLSKPKSLTWGVNLSGTIKTGTGNISYQVTNGTYYYNASAINGTFDRPLGWWRLTNDTTVLLHNESSFGGVKVVVNGKNVADANITFARAYNLTFEEVGIGNGFKWDVNLSNGLGTTLDKSITVSNSTTEVFFNSTEGNYTNSTYAGSIQTLVYGVTGVRYHNFTNPTTLSEVVNGNNIVNVTNFVTQYFLTTRSIPITGGYHFPYSEWVNASSKVQLSASDNSSYQFSGFQGSNTSSYSGMGTYSNGQYIQTITMTNPITENMTFNNYLVLTFYMENITSGTEWGVKLTQGSSLVQWNNGTGNYIVFEIPGGSYSYLITGVSSFPQSNTISVSDSMTVLLQYKITTYQVGFKEQGLQSGQNWEMEISQKSTGFSITMTSTSDKIYFQLPNGSYFYGAGTIYGYIANNSTGSFTVSGSSLAIPVNWTEGNSFILQGIRNFVAITLNTTNFQIPSGTQIPINVNWTKYASYEDPNLSNVMILNSTFYPLYSWIQNNASSSYKNSTVWVLLDQGIPYYSSQTIYLAFMDKNRNNLNPVGYFGEAPQLSPIYNEWNNIAQVMSPGLLLQFYTNPSAADQIVDVPGPIVIAANYSEDSSFIFNGITYTATEGYSITPQSGTTQEVFYDVTGGYDPYAVENNVVVSYQTNQGSYPGTWPSPPIINTTNSQSWAAKAEGFVQQNNVNTNWYAITDDMSYLNISNSTAPIGSNWAKGINLLNGNFGIGPGSAVSKIQGTAEMAFIYWERSGGQAMWQFWSSYPVNFYHPNPVNDLPKLIANISFGAIASSYSSFYEYGLPVNTNWSIAISEPGFSHLYTTNSNLIYTYLPDGTYLYTVGSEVNGSYHSGIDGNFIPSPESGHVIVTGTFTVQYIIFSLNKVLKYNIEPEQASGSGNNITLPLLVINVQGLPAGPSTIGEVESHLNATFISENDNRTSPLTWKISSTKTGMIVIFLNISIVEINEVKNGTAVVSFVSGFQLGTIVQVAAGVAGTSVFSSVSTSPGPPTSSSAPGGKGVSSINQIIGYLAYLETTTSGRALYLILILLGIMFYTVSISKHVKKRN